MAFMKVRSFLVLAMGIVLCLPAMSKAAPPPYTSPEMAKNSDSSGKRPEGPLSSPRRSGLIRARRLS